MPQHVNDFIIPVTVAGALTAATVGRFVAPFDLQILGVSAVVGAAPGTNPILVDVHIEGTTVWATQANRVTVAVGATEGTAIARPDAKYTEPLEEGIVRSYESGGVANAGDLVEVIVDQIGTTPTGSDLTLLVHAIKV